MRGEGTGPVVHSLPDVHSCKGHHRRALAAHEEGKRHVRVGKDRLDKLDGEVDNRHMVDDRGLGVGSAHNGLLTRNTLVGVVVIVHGNLEGSSHGADHDGHSNHRILLLEGPYHHLLDGMVVATWNDGDPEAVRAGSGGWINIVITGWVIE